MHTCESKIERFNTKKRRHGIFETIKKDYQVKMFLPTPTQRLIQLVTDSSKYAVCTVLHQMMKLSTDYNFFHIY